MREQEFALGELGGDHLRVEEAGDVERDGIVNGLFVTVFKGGVGVLVERTRAAGKRAVGSAVLDVALEELALFENEGRILAGAHGDVEDRHDGGADESGLVVFGLLNYAGDVAAEDGCGISVHGKFF